MKSLRMRNGRPASWTTALPVLSMPLMASPKCLNTLSGFAGAASVSLSTNDLGNSGSGGNQSDTDVVRVDDWDRYRAVMAGHPTVVVSWHLGNFEPFGIYFAVHGLVATLPIEEIRPPELYRFLAARRGGAHGVELVPLSGSRRRLVQRLREGGLVGIIGDRDLSGGGLRLEIFGHPTTFPTGPASLCVVSGARLIVGRCLRIGPERYAASGEIVEVERTGNRRADVEALTRRIAAAFEADVAAHPDQWWGAFQPFWPDLRPAAAEAAA